MKPGVEFTRNPVGSPRSVVLEKAIGGASDRDAARDPPSDCLSRDVEMAWLPQIELSGGHRDGLEEVLADM
jgi:hypothetical protein